MAKAALEAALMRRGLTGVEVSSAGTLGIVGSPADPLAVGAARESGYDLSSHRSEALTATGIEIADVVLVMEEDHARRVRDLAPQVREVALLGAYLPPAFRMGSADEIPDPIGGDAQIFRTCLSMIEQAVSRFLQERPQLAAGEGPADAPHGGGREDAEQRYFREIERRILEARGGGPGLSSLEFHIVDGWWRRGIPLWLVLEAAGETALNWPPGEAPRGFVRSLDGAVERRDRESGIGSNQADERPSGPAPAEPPHRQVLRKRLQQAARRAGAAHPHLQASLDRAARLMDETGDDQASIQDAMARCREEIQDAARRSLPLGALQSMEAEERRRLHQLSGRLSAGAFEETLRRLLEDRILDYFHLPQLDLAGYSAFEPRLASDDGAGDEPD
jgi:protein-tyrosine-phosphatase